MKEKILEAQATAILIGTIIGAGVLGIPYTIAQSGFLLGMLMIVFLGFAVLIVNLFVGEITLRTKGNYQLTGYAEKYLGKIGKKLMTITLILVIYGVLTAYIIGEGETLSAIFGLTPFIFSLIFFAFMSLIVFIGLKIIKRIEFPLMIITITIVLIISLISFTKINLSNLATVNLSNLFVPYGAILLASLGIIAIPEMKEVLEKNKKLLKRSIIIGSLIPPAAYLIFAAAVIGVTDLNTTEIATIGLGNILGKKMIVFGNLFAIFAMAASSLPTALALKQIYNYDYKLNKTLSWFLTCSIPLAAFLLGIKSFIKTIGITGAIAGGIECILVILIYWSARFRGDRLPEYRIKRNFFLVSLLILVFITGIVYTILKLI